MSFGGNLVRHITARTVESIAINVTTVTQPDDGNIVTNELTAGEINGDATGNQLTIKVQDQTTTDADGNNIVLQGGLLNGTATLNGEINFASNFFTSSKNNGAIEAASAVTIANSTGTIIVSTASMGTTAAGFSLTIFCTLPSCKSTSVIQLSPGGEYLTSGGTGYPTPLVEGIFDGSFLVHILNQHSTAAFNSKAFTFHYTVM